MSAPAELSRTVRARADGRCQYCLMHDSLQGATFLYESAETAVRVQIVKDAKGMK